MKLRTEIEIQKSAIQVSHSDCCLSIGSCFAQNIGQRLKKLKFNLLLNPHGILFHPMMIHKILDDLNQEKQYTENDLEQGKERWVSWDHHGRFSGESKAECLDKITAERKPLKAQFSKMNRLFLTFGTAFGYHLQSTGQLVANCHKFPRNSFEKKLASIEEMKASYLVLLPKLKQQQPDLEIVLTVSPIRHIRDGILENSRSKSRLLSLVYDLAEALPYVHYFPSYEILMDDLRDYRFYNADLIHPSETALSYVYQQFDATFLSKKTREIMGKIEKVQASLAHRPNFAASEKHQAFLGGLRLKIAALRLEFPSLDFSAEEAQLKN